MSLKIQEIVKPVNYGFAAVSKKLLIDDLTKKYVALIEPKIKVLALKYGKDYFIYATIPSKTNEKYTQSEDKIYYDTIIQLTAPNSAMEKKDDNIRHWDVRVYSNNPMFIYTFNYVYNSRNALIKLPNGYYSRPAMKIKPKTRNPMMLTGIDDNLWFLVMYMDKNHYFDRTVLESACTNSGVDYKWLIKNITPQEEKLLEVKDRNIRNKNTKKKEKELEKLSKNEKERKEKQNEDDTLKTGHALKSSLYTEKLRNSNFNDLSSNLNSSNSSLSIKKTVLNNVKTKKSNLKSRL